MQPAFVIGTQQGIPVYAPMLFSRLRFARAEVVVLKPGSEVLRTAVFVDRPRACTPIA